YYPPFEHWIEVRVYPAPEGLSVSFRDISLSRRLTETLRESESRYRSLIDHVPAVIYVLANDERQTPLYLSPRHEELTGYSNEEALGRTGHWLEFVHPDDRERVAAEHRRSRAYGEAFRAEYRLPVAVDRGPAGGASLEGDAAPLDLEDEEAVLGVEEEEVDLPLSQRATARGVRVQVVGLRVIDAPGVGQVAEGNPRLRLPGGGALPRAARDRDVRDHRGHGAGGRVPRSGVGGGGRCVRGRRRSWIYRGSGPASASCRSTACASSTSSADTTRHTTSRFTPK
ncbi:MAG: PAS domain S-box protein, partial [Acidobacteria bacterium ACB2]|nr:PAS domain S-box protein [Acidobacteria bacterium ACB2]